MEEHETAVVEAAENEEERSEPRQGTLRVADMDAGQSERRTLLASFRDAGWKPGIRTEIAWREFEEAVEQRAITWSGSVDDVLPLRRESGAFGADQRYAWPAFPRVAVDAGTTSVQVLTQTARTLPMASDVVRDIDETSSKPEAGSTITVNPVSLNQVAAVQSGIPNVYLQQDQLASILGTDLRLAVNEGLDKLVLDAIDASGFQPPSSDPLLISIRKAMTTILAAGYNPDLLVLTPANAEALDTLQTDGSEAFYVFGAGRFAPGQLFGMNVRISKTIAAPAVVDSQALGRLYASPISFSTFEENAGGTNTSLVRLEGHAAFGVERQDAAVRIAAS